MLLVIDKKYLLLPVNRYMTVKKIEFLCGGRLVYDLDCALDFCTPEHYMYVNMTPFIGSTLEIRCGACDISGLTLADKLPEDIRKDAYRPFSHYTEAVGWTNDPNGLFFLDGKYHMFYQHNPAGTPWGNMHWGHAVSDDMTHWTQTDEAMYPDKNGTMYSGSAYVDKANASGLGDGKTPAVLFYYTAAGNNSLLSKNVRFTQRLAYSNDGGMTLTKLEGEPLIPHIEAENRDPKVIFCPELDKYVLALYLNGNDYALFTSNDLLKWEMHQTLTLDGDAECPDFYPLTVEGTDERKWVLSGASDRYAVGSFTDGKFTIEQQPRQHQYGGSHWYASQTFDNTNERLKIYWSQVNAPSSYFTHQMSVPVEVALVATDDGYRLRELPSEHIKSLYLTNDEWEHVRINGTRRIALEKAAYDISLSFSRAERDFSFTVFGRTLKVSPPENKMSVEGAEAPLSYGNGRHELRIISDKLSLEVFADGGLIFAPKAVVSDYNRPYIEVKSENVVFDKIRIAKLDNINKE